MYLGFFILLFMALFLGDGQQPLVDIYIAVALVIWSLSVSHFFKPARDLPRVFTRLWSGLLVFYFCAIFFSISPGLSVTSFIRLTFSYLVFYVFYRYSPSPKNSLFSKYLLVFVALAASISFILPFFPGLASRLPFTNLLYANFGHNHLAALLLLAFPIVLHRLSVRNGLFSITLLAIFISAFLLTFGRGALLLLSGYLIVVNLRKNFRLSLLGLVPLLFFLFLNFSPPPGRPTQSSRLSLWIKNQVYKPYSLLDSRLNYFNQAQTAFRDNWLMGAGPGTFSLLSEKYSHSSDTVSFYAHSFPLQLLAETGLVGGLLWVSLLFRLLKIGPKKTSPLRTGVYLLLIYSVIDFSLDFSVIWLLFWSSAATLLIENPVFEPASNRSRWVFRVCLACLTVFYIFSFTSLLFSHSKNVRLKLFASYLVLFDRQTANKVLETSPFDMVPSGVALRLINYFHRSDPAVQMALYAYQKPHLDQKTILSRLRYVTSLSPHNLKPHLEFIKAAFKASSPADFGSELTLISLLKYPHLKSVITGVNFSDPRLISLADTELGRILANMSVYEPLYKIYYLLGLSVIDTDPQVTLSIWDLAINSYPTLGLLYTEQAAVYLYKYSDMDMATRIMAACSLNPKAYLHCQNINSDLSNLPPPGNTRQPILTDPYY